MADHMFLKKWKKEQVNLIKLAHPEWDSEKIKEILDKKIDDKLKNPECALVNNYINVSARTTLLDLYDYIELKKPIIAGGGVLFNVTDNLGNMYARLYVGVKIVNLVSITSPTFDI